MSLLEKAAALIGPFEGRVSHMYLDSVGVVTCGVGCALPLIVDAQALRWQFPDGAEASPLEIEAEWQRVAAAVPGRRAETYRGITALDLPDDEIDRIFRRRLRDKLDHLAEHFPAIATFPEPAQIALLDLAYNLGASAIVRKFPRLTIAVRHQDWRTAAQECYRPQARDRRNAAVKELFLAAAGEGGATPVAELDDVDTEPMKVG